MFATWERFLCFSCACSCARALVRGSDNRADLTAVDALFAATPAEKQEQNYNPNTHKLKTLGKGGVLKKLLLISLVLFGSVAHNLYAVEASTEMAASSDIDSLKTWKDLNEWRKHYPPSYDDGAYAGYC